MSSSRKKGLVLALDCGTTGNRAMVFDHRQSIRAQSYREFTQYYPQPGWVEHDAEEIWVSVLRVLKDVACSVPLHRMAAVGITNQRETIVLWDKRTGKPVSRAIVWQCRRTSELCGRMKKEGTEDVIHRRTGLFLDPYFSASKIRWLQERFPAIRKGLHNGTILCGTIDTWIAWKLTRGRSFTTDPTNASRTMLFNIRKGSWDPELCRIFRVPLHALPRILPCLSDRARIDRGILGREIPILGMAGDQQSASFAQGCFRRGVIKNTYGTGLFLVAETGSKIKWSRRLITTVAVSTSRELRYALEGSIFIGGAAIQWLRDNLGILNHAGQSQTIAKRLKSNEGVYFVPALVGLGCPHWDPEARGVIVGLTRKATREHLVRAALEAMAYQTRDVLELLRKEIHFPIRRLSADGGAVKNDFLMQFQADIAGCDVERPKIIETTALGAAGLAGIASGIWSDPEDFLKSRRVDRVFKPRMKKKMRETYYREWLKAVQHAIDRF